MAVTEQLIRKRRYLNRKDLLFRALGGSSIDHHRSLQDYTLRTDLYFTRHRKLWESILIKLSSIEVTMIQHRV